MGIFQNDNDKKMNMKDNRMIWFTSDEHYGSERTLKLSRRPFKNVEEMNDTLISLFNDKVSETDITIHLGDFGDFNMLKWLPGRHFLILGNYEIDQINKEFDGNYDLYESYLINEVGFERVYPNHYYFSLDQSDLISCKEQWNDGNSNLFYLTHKPSDCKKDLAYMEKLFNLFGHIHGRQAIKTYGLDIGVDAHHFYPINIDDVKFYQNAIINHYDENVFE